MGAAPARAICCVCIAAALPMLARADVIAVIDATDDAEHLLDAGSSELRLLRERVGLRDLKLAVRALAPAIERRTNLCQNPEREGYPAPSASSSTSGYGDCVWAGVDGVPWAGEYEWCNDHTEQGIPWYSVDFGHEELVGEARLFTRESYPLRHFTVILQTAQGDVTVAEVTDNTAPEWRVTFAPITATGLRVVCHSGPDHQPSIRRIQELQAFAPTPVRPAEPVSFAYGLEVPDSELLFLEVREAYSHPDTLHEFEYEVRLDGETIHTRRHRCDGAGFISYAFELAGTEPGEHRLEFVDTSGQGVAIGRVRLIADPVATATERGLIQPFIIAPRITLHPPFDNPTYDDALGEWVDVVSAGAPFVRPGLLAIVGYAARDPETIRQHIQAYADLAERHNIPWILQLSTWWADTPLRVPDGLGGTFGDIRYQQIGWSELDTYDDPGLRDYIESRAPGTYDPRYGLTVPNIWSSTPWLTMNDDRLNAYKLERLREAIGIVNELQQQPGGELLCAIVTDDEPMYWPRITDWRNDGYSSVNGGVQRADLILDVNPCVVEDAAADGVLLDPRDGLSSTERLWLHENNARYAGLICTAIRDTLSPPPDQPTHTDLRDHVYNYILAQPCYPLDDYGHPGWELGIVPGSAVGLEAFDKRYFERARDLGPLANSDMECANPSAEVTSSWEGRFQDWHDVGCRFIQLCNPGPAENWRGMFGRVGMWDPEQRSIERALSALTQEAAIADWRDAQHRTE